MNRPGEEAVVGDYSIEVAQDRVEWNSMGHHEVDPDWRFVDAAGHVHVSMETVEWVATSSFWCEACHDEHEEGEYRCRQCGEVVEPGYRWTGPQRGFSPGMREYTLKLLDGRVFSISAEEAEGLAQPGAEERGAVLEVVLARGPDAWKMSA